MSFVGVGAYVDGKRPKSKKALREAIESTPESVVFHKTSTFGSVFINTVADLLAHPEHTLSVVGPDPDHSRVFYGTIEVKNGKVRVS